MHVRIVDPPAFTPPYDRALCAALARAGAEVELVTSPFRYGPVPPAEGYRVVEEFHRRSGARPVGAGGRRAVRAAEHAADMLRHRRHPGDASVWHYQWLPVPALDRALLPAAARPRVLTVHDPLPAEAGAARRSLAGWVARGFDAVVSHSRRAARDIEARLGVDAARIRVVPHGALDYLARQPGERPLPPELAAVRRPVVLLFGLVRPYKGTEVLLRAFARLGGEAELWVVGLPRVPMDSLHELAASVPGRVRFVERFVTDPEIPAFFRRADLVVLPYLEADQSGVLYTALAFGSPLVLSDVGGFDEVAATGAARLVRPGDVEGLAGALQELLADPDQRARLAAAARAAAAGPYSWDTAAAAHLELYRELLAR